MILSIGHPTLDLFLPLQEQDVQLRDLDGGLKELGLPFPDKLRVDRLDMCPGGNAVNVAAGLRTLGHEAELLVHESDDVPGRILSEYYEKVGIPVRGNLEKEETDVSVVLSYEGDRVIISHHEPASWNWIGLPEEVEWVYLSSIGTKQFQPFHAELKDDLLAHPDVQCAYNPGSRELRHPAEELEILEEVDLLILNRKEACKLLDRRPESASDSFIRDLILALSSYGPERVVITDGDDGAWAYADGELFYQPPFPTDVVESTGAGDSFSVGCVGALMSGKALTDGLRWGGAMAHAVLQEIGATEGFLTRTEMNQVLDQFAERRPERRGSG